MLKRYSKKFKNVNIRTRIGLLAVAALLFLTVLVALALLEVNISIIVGIYLVTAFLGVVVTKIISYSICHEITCLKDVMEEVADGNLDVVISDELRSEDEFKSLIESIEKTLVQLNMYNDYITEVADVLNVLGSGKMKVDLAHSYDGKFAVIKDGLLQISSSLNTTLQAINESSDLVALESDRMEQAASQLSDGTADQASSIEELTASIQEITNQVSSNANGALEAKNKTRDMENVVVVSNEKMSQLNLAMDDIKTSSNDIVNIIQTIEGIANQTNLLALNASIEAARAGEMGKGFAVVATEIGNLANQSVNAVRMTTELIQNTIHAVERGVVLAKETAKTTDHVAVAAKDITGYMDQISENSQSQTMLLQQFSQAIEQIATVVDGTQQTAIESANTSSALKQEAFTLKEKVGAFELY